MKHIKQNHLIPIIFLLALIIRLIFVIPSENIPSSDAANYDRLGLSLSKGLGYADNNSTPHSYCPPFYPFFLSVIYKIFGHSYPAVRVIQSIIGALICVFIYLAARKVCAVRVGLWSAFISMAYPPFIKSAELLLTELFFTFVLVLIVFYLLEIQEGAGLKKCAILGLLLGVSSLTRPVMLLFPFFIIPVFIHSPATGGLSIPPKEPRALARVGSIYSNRMSLPKMLKKYSVVLLFFSLVILPWVARNYSIYHKFVLVSTHGGATLYSSYCPPKGIFGMLATAEDPIMAEASRIASPVEQSDFLTKKTIDFIKNNPAKVCVLELKKILYLWAPFDWEIVGGRWFNFIYVIALPFFAIGFLFAVRRLKIFYPILLPIIYFQIMTLIFYGSPRFRLPLEPYLFILAIIGVMATGKYISRKKGNKYDDICNNSGL